MTFDRGTRVRHPLHGEGSVSSVSRNLQGGTYEVLAVWVVFDAHRSPGIRPERVCEPQELEIVAPSTLPLWERLWAF